jgi:xanthine/CO dehydrogenase XdhC/CoxF family maturation factor
MQQFFVKMTALTAQEESFVLATIITRNGSAPRSTGARMLRPSAQSAVEF